MHPKASRTDNKHGGRQRRKPGHAPNEGLSFASDAMRATSEVALSGTALAVTTDLTEERLSTLIRQAADIERGSRWWLGDLLVYGKDRFGLTYVQAQKATSYSYGTLRNIAWVARNVAADHRRPDLPWSVHCTVAPLTAAEQVEWLERAAQEGMTASELRRELTRHRGVTHGGAASKDDGGAEPRQAALRPGATALAPGAQVAGEPVRTVVLALEGNASLIASRAADADVWTYAVRKAVTS